MILKPHFARIGMKQTDYVLERDRLATPRWPHDHGGLAAGKVNRDSVEHFKLPERLSDILEPNYRPCSGRELIGRRVRRHGIVRH